MHLSHLIPFLSYSELFIDSDRFKPTLPAFGAPIEDTDRQTHDDGIYPASIASSGKNRDMQLRLQLSAHLHHWTDRMNLLQIRKGRGDERKRCPTTDGCCSLAVAHTLQCTSRWSCCHTLSSFFAIIPDEKPINSLTGASGSPTGGGLKCPSPAPYPRSTTPGGGEERIRGRVGSGGDKEGRGETLSEAKSKSK